MSRKKDIELMAPLLAEIENKGEDSVRRELSLLSARALRKERREALEIMAQIGVGIDKAISHIDATLEHVRRARLIIRSSGIRAHPTVQ